MAYPSQKATDLALLIQEELAMRLGAAGVNMTGSCGAVQFDTDGYPWMQFGVATTANAGGVIKVEQRSWTNAKDILGNTANQYGPLVIKMVEEKDNASGNGVDGTFNSLAVRLAILGVLINKGCQLMQYQTANTVVPAVSGGVNGTLKATFETTLQYPMISSQ